MRCFSLSHFMDSLHLITFNVKDIEIIWKCSSDLLYSENQYAKETIFKFAGKIMVVYIYTYLNNNRVYLYLHYFIKICFNFS